MICVESVEYEKRRDAPKFKNNIHIFNIAYKTTIILLEWIHKNHL